MISEGTAMIFSIAGPRSSPSWSEGRLLRRYSSSEAQSTRWARCSGARQNSLPPSLLAMAAGRFDEAVTHYEEMPGEAAEQDTERTEPAL